MTLLVAIYYIFMLGKHIQRMLCDTNDLAVHISRDANLRGKRRTPRLYTWQKERQGGTTQTRVSAFLTVVKFRAERFLTVNTETYDDGTLPKRRKYVSEATDVITMRYVTFIMNGVR